jgi:2',3'-cyclic-nucleotide 2'-phosphodiesterase (5'-nucleotidase family)
MSSPEDIRFASTVDTTKAQAAALRREGADYVVAVLHCNRGDALVLQYAGAADLMLTGHTHDLFVNFTSDCGIVESGYDAHYVTCIDVEITVRDDGSRRTMTWWPQFRVIDSASVTPDPDVLAAVKRFETELIEKIGTPIGTTAVELDSRTAIVRTREAAIGNLIADAMRAGTRADAALINGGGIRAAKVYQPGQTLTHADILAELPFNNRVVVVELSGAALKAAIENGLSALPGPAGRFPQVSGIKVVYDATHLPGSRVVSMQVDGAPLVETKNYRVAILDFLARGGDDYTMLRDALRITPDNDAPMLVNEVAEYVRKIGTVRSTVEARVTAK